MAEEQYSETLHKLQAAISANDKDDNLHFQLGNLYATTRQPVQAEEAYREAIRLNSDNVDAWNNLGNILCMQGRTQEGRECYEKVLALQPDSMSTLNNLGNLYTDLKEYQRAQEYYRRALKLEPGNTAILQNLGDSYLKDEQLQSADACFIEIARIDPQMALRFALTAQKTGNPNEALRWYERLLSANPNESTVYNNMGVIYLEQGNLERALSLFEKAFELDPGNAEALNNQGLVFKEKNMLRDCIPVYQRAIETNPQLIEAWLNLGRLYVELGDAFKAVEIYNEASKLSPGNDVLRVLSAKVLPPIYSSREDMLYWRQRFEREISVLVQSGVTLRNPVMEIGASNYYLPYHGLSNRKLHAQYAELFRDMGLYRKIQEWPKHEKIRVGFISRHLFPEHTIGKLFLGLIDQLSREKFDVTVISLANRPTQLKAPYTQIHISDTHIGQARQIIAEQELDILFYTDIGMDPLTYYLAFERLSPVQCVSFGHPDTTGAPELDYYLSNTWLESESGQDEYTEELVQLDTLPFYFSRPERSAREIDRAYFGLPQDARLYCCPQTQFKFHPDFDEYLGGILRADPEGILVLLKAPRPEWADLNQRRFEKTIPDVANRIHYLDYLTQDDFYHLLNLVDVTLDTLYFGAGSSAYELFAFNSPIVTQPTQFLRGRFVYACYQMMGISDCIVSNKEEYIQLAVRLAKEPQFRQEIQERIKERSDVLLESQTAVQAVEDFFIHAYEKALTELLSVASPTP